MRCNYLTWVKTREIPIWSARIFHLGLCHLPKHLFSGFQYTKGWTWEILSYLTGDKKYFNIALVLQDEWLTIFTCPANSCTCPLKAYTINNIRGKYYHILQATKIFHNALVLQDEWLTIFTRPANTCTCPLKVYTINNISGNIYIMCPGPH